MWTAILFIWNFWPPQVILPPASLLFPFCRHEEHRFMKHIKIKSSRYWSGSTSQRAPEFLCIFTNWSKYINGFKSSTSVTFIPNPCSIETKKNFIYPISKKWSTLEATLQIMYILSNYSLRNRPLELQTVCYIAIPFGRHQWKLCFYHDSNK